MEERFGGEEAVFRWRSGFKVDVRFQGGGAVLRWRRSGFDVKL